MKLRRFLLAGIGIEAIYVAAALGPLSLLPHATDIVDLSKLTGVSFAAAALVTLALVLLFALYLLGAREATTTSASVGVAIGMTVLFSATMLFVYPFTATDVYNYAVEGHVAAFDRINPLTTAPTVASWDSFTEFGGMWSNSPSPYGPIWILASVAISFIAGDRIVLAVVLFKLLGALSVIATTVLLAYATRHAVAGTRALAVILFGWNPLVQIDLVANGHNDALVMLFVVAGLVAFAERKRLWGGISVGASLFIKILAIGLVPLYVIALAFDRESGVVQRLARLVALFLALAVIGFLTYRPYWVGIGTLHRLLVADGDYLASPASLLTFLDPASRDWLMYPRVAIAAVVGLWQASRIVLAKTTLAVAAFEVFFATFVLAAHFAGWYLPLLLAVGVLGLDRSQLRRVIVFTFTATMVTPLWAYVYDLDLAWNNAESFHFIVVPLTFVLPLVLTFWPARRTGRSPVAGQSFWGERRALRS